jgi:hypothetical protein
MGSRISWRCLVMSSDCAERRRLGLSSRVISPVVPDKISGGRSVSTLFWPGAWQVGKLAFQERKSLSVRDLKRGASLPSAPRGVAKSLRSSSRQLAQVSSSAWETCAPKSGTLGRPQPGCVGVVFDSCAHPDGGTAPSQGGLRARQAREKRLALRPSLRYDDRRKGMGILPEEVTDVCRFS